jgi:hypothetical protein
MTNGVVVTSASEQGRMIRVPRHRVHRALAMSRQHLNQRPRLHVPHVDLPVLAPTQDKVPVQPAKTAPDDKLALLLAHEPSDQLMVL